MVILVRQEGEGYCCWCCSGHDLTVTLSVAMAVGVREEGTHRSQSHSKWQVSGGQAAGRPDHSTVKPETQFHVLMPKPSLAWSVWIAHDT